MAEASTDQYSAREQGLGYIYQPRFALLSLLQLPEGASVLIEKDNDRDFVDKDGLKTLTSLKHKEVGDRLPDLSTDFWKSIRIWLARYNRDGRSEAKLCFFHSRPAPSQRDLSCGVSCLSHWRMTKNWSHCRSLQAINHRRSGAWLEAIFALLPSPNPPGLVVVPGIQTSQ